MKERGITLIELLVTLAISAILVAGIYKTFISQQHTYAVQEQVVDVQQNVRIAINQMMRELRMAGYGIDSKFWDEYTGADPLHGKYKNAITPEDGGQKVTIVSALLQATTLASNADSGSNTLLLNDASIFDIAGKKYFSINGIESHRIKSITYNVDGDKDQISLFPGVTLTQDHKAGDPVFMILAVTYSLGVVDGKTCLLRDENLGDGAQPVAENIESLQFQYVMNTGETLVDVPANRRDDIRMVQATVIAKTAQTDPEYKENGGYRRRTLSSMVKLRNLGT
ncbi:MAG: prepilin-type N-terminal cleavage/methylation domain-containing protein [Thermodesulfobacteriota bacterium]